MQHLVLVAVCSSFEELIHKAPDCIGFQSAAIPVLVHVLLQILFAEFKNEDELCFGMNNIMQSDDIDMLEFFHQRDFSNGGGRSAFFCIKMYFLQSHNFICYF